MQMFFPQQYFKMYACCPPTFCYYLLTLPQYFLSSMYVHFLLLMLIRRSVLWPATGPKLIWACSPSILSLSTYRWKTSLLLDGKMEIWQVYLYITSSAIQYTEGYKRKRVLQVVTIGNICLCISFTVFGKTFMQRTIFFYM